MFVRCDIRNINGASADEGVTFLPIPVAVRSKSHICSCLIAGIAGSHPAEDICSSLVRFVCCISSVHSNGLITRSEESYRVSELEIMHHEVLK